MNTEELVHLKYKLRSGEYDGVDIMKAGIAIESLLNYQAASSDKISDKVILNCIMSSEKLHDLVTHLNDFENACDSKVISQPCQESRDYWSHQLNIVRSLKGYIKTLEKEK